MATKLPLVVDVDGVQAGLGSQLARLAAARIDLGLPRPRAWYLPVMTP